MNLSMLISSKIHAVNQFGLDPTISVLIIKVVYIMYDSGE